MIKTKASGKRLEKDVESAWLEAQTAQSRIE
jgi:hypothetical protein